MVTIAVQDPPRKFSRKVFAKERARQSEEAKQKREGESEAERRSKHNTRGPRAKRVAQNTTQFSYYTVTTENTQAPRADHTEQEGRKAEAEGNRTGTAPNLARTPRKKPRKKRKPRKFSRKGFSRKVFAKKFSGPLWLPGAFALFLNDRLDKTHRPPNQDLKNQELLWYLSWTHVLGSGGNKRENESLTATRPVKTNSECCTKREDERLMLQDEWKRSVSAAVSVKRKS